MTRAHEEATSSILPYELRIGVTGHRSIADEPEVRVAVRNLLSRIDRTLNRPDCTPLSWTVVSPLARGADRLVADEVLQRPNARLEVVTPFRLEEYRNDFDSPNDLQEFERLLARAALVNELEELVPQSSQPSGPAHRAERDVAYLRVGERVVDACEILVAVWNGRRAAGVGGTADIVQYALNRERVVLWIHAERPRDEPRLIRSIASADEPNAEVRSVDAESVPAVAKRLSPGYHQQAAYCVDNRLASGRYSESLRRAREALVNASMQAGLPRESLDPVLTLLVPAFVRADELALLYQIRHTRAVAGLLYLAGFAVTVAVAQVLFFPDRLGLILFEVAAMVAVFCLWWYSRREAWHEKWLHDRFLAERLRGAIFTTLAGCAPEEARPDDPLPFYRGPQNWLTLAVDSLSRLASRKVPPDLASLKRFLGQAWLQDQRGFHERNERNKTRRARRRHVLGLGLFGVTLVMATLHLFGIGHSADAGAFRLARPDVWITFLAIVLPVWAGVVHAMTAQLELERVAERSGRMTRVLGGLAHRLTGTRTAEELRQVVLEAADVMKVENREWWVLLSFQDPKLHV